MNNFTHVVLNKTLSPLDLIDTGPAFIGICCFFTFIVEIFGNGNLLIMMIYERFAMDPQKRTVNNQLIFNLCLSNIIQNLISCPLLTYRMLVSPLSKLSLKSFSHFFIGHNSKSVNVNLIFIDHTGAVMATYTIVVNMVYSALTLAEMTILKCLYISKWSKMAMIEDDFLARIFAEFNFFISITMTLIRIYLDEPMNNLHYIRLRGFQQSNLPEKYQTSFSTINTW